MNMEICKLFLYGKTSVRTCHARSLGSCLTTIIFILQWSLCHRAMNFTLRDLTGKSIRIAGVPDLAQTPPPWGGAWGGLLASNSNKRWQGLHHSYLPYYHQSYRVHTIWLIYFLVWLTRGRQDDPLLFTPGALFPGFTNVHALPTGIRLLVHWSHPKTWLY